MESLSFGAADGNLHQKHLLIVAEANSHAHSLGYAVSPHVRKFFAPWRARNVLGAIAGAPKCRRRCPVFAARRLLHARCAGATVYGISQQIHPMRN